MTNKKESINSKLEYPENNNTPVSSAPNVLTDHNEHSVNIGSENIHRGSNLANIITGWTFLIFGIIGVILAGIITTEKFAVLENSSHELACSLNESFSCGSVFSSWQASSLGFPNMIIGLAGFAIIATIGAGILAGAKFNPWFWLATTIGLVLATIFAHWLFYSAVYKIGALCLYCMGVWAVTIILMMNNLSRVFQDFAPQEGALKIITEILIKWWWLLALLWYGGLMLLTYIEFTS